MVKISGLPAYGTFSTSYSHMDEERVLCICQHMQINENHVCARDSYEISKPIENKCLSKTHVETIQSYGLEKLKIEQAPVHVLVCSVLYYYMPLPFTVNEFVIKYLCVLKINCHKCSQDNWMTFLTAVDQSIGVRLLAPVT